MNTVVSVRLALVNAIGFSASTVMPLWLGRIAGELAMPGWFAGLAIICQIGSAAILNLCTPWLFRGTKLLRLARIALLAAAGGYLLAANSSPAFFLAGCLVSGAGLGVVLNVTNRLMGSAEHVQKGYALFVIIEVCFATLVFLGCNMLIARAGLLALFRAVAMLPALGIILLHRLPFAESMPQDAAPTGRSAQRTRARLALASFVLFFVGQASLNSFMPTIGHAAGLDTNTAGRAIGLGMPFGFVGALLARAVGERVPPIVPVLLVVGALSCAAPLLTLAPTMALYVATIVTLAISTMFSVPYFFAELGALDRSGRYASFGPAMMLIGIATGPSAAVLLDQWRGLAAVGALSSTLLVLSGLTFVGAVHSGDRGSAATATPVQ